MDFSKYLFRVSSLTHLMSGVKTFKEDYDASLMAYEQAFAKYEAANTKLDSMSKGTIGFTKYEITVNNYWNKLEKAKAEADRLELLEHDIQLSDGCKTHLLDLHTCFSFDRPTRDLKTKYFKKGTRLEPQAIALYSDTVGRFYRKNEDRLDDGYIMGEWDFDDDIVVYDTKVSWDCWTFRRNIKYRENPRSCPYYPNMQGYMRILKKPKAKLVYTLLDTPRDLINAEKRKLLYDFVGTPEMYEEACVELERNLTYTDIDPKKRIIEVEIPRDEEYIERIPKVVDCCRTYLNNLKDFYYEMD